MRTKLMISTLAVAFALGLAAPVKAASDKGVDCLGGQGSPGQAAQALGQNGVGNVVNSDPTTVPGQEANALAVFCVIQNGNGGNTTTNEFPNRTYIRVGVGADPD